MGRAGRSVFRHTRRRRLRWLRANWKFLALVFGAVLLYTGFLVVWRQWNFVNGVALGAIWAGAIGATFYVMALTGEARRRMGGVAEQWTAKVLRRLGKDWVVLHDLEFADGNVDHVAVGPDFVVAVETKWTTREVELVDLDDWTRRDVEQCAERARRVRLLLHSERVSRRVVPLLVYWGPGAWELPHEPVRHDEVRVVSGPYARNWIGKLREAATGSTRDAEAAAALTRYVTRRAAHERSEGSLLRRLLPQLSRGAT